MAASLQWMGFSMARRALARSTSVSQTRSLASESDALVEIKPGEIGFVSGIPEQHLRRRNPLMEWTSTGDPYANVGDAALTFDSEEAAKAFAEKYGWDYVVRKLHTPLLKPKSYADNFKWKSPPKTEDA